MEFGVYRYWEKKNIPQNGYQAGIRLGNYTDPTEIFLINTGLPGSQPFKLNKINYAWAAKPFVGKTWNLAKRNSRMDVGLRLFTNVSIPIMKYWPVYVMIYIPNPPFDGYVPERYDPAIHHPENIGGVAQYSKGFSEGTWVVGMGAQAGFQIEWGSYRSISNSVSFGVSNDVFVQKIPLIYGTSSSSQMFPALFVTFAFGFGDIN